MARLEKAGVLELWLNIHEGSALLCHRLNSLSQCLEMSRNHIRIALLKIYRSGALDRIELDDLRLDDVVDDGFLVVGRRSPLLVALAIADISCHLK